jgi:hypothetical protein
MTWSNWRSNFPNRILVFSKEFTMLVIFFAILVNLPIICSWKFFLSFLIIDYVVAFEIDYFFNNSLLFSNWGNSMSLVDVVTHFITVPIWCHNWSMDYSNLHSCISSFEMLLVNLLVVYCLNNKLNFFWHVSIFFVNIRLVTTMRACNSTIQSKV